MRVYNYILITLAVLLLGFLIVMTVQKPITKVWLKRLINTIVITTVIIMVLAVVLFPDFSNVKTTGIYSYTSCTLELEDNSRIEDYKGDGSFRKLSVVVYYPTNDTLQKGDCPLIVFSHGGISYSTSNISLYRELASQGYVVVSIDHTYHALFTKISDKTVFIDSGYVKELNTEDSHKDIANSYAHFQKWMGLRTGDIIFVIDSFTKTTEDNCDSFYSLIDTENIGVIGHSLGGTAALGVARQRKDIKAVVALESPYMCDITGINGEDFTWNTEPYSCAIMNIYSDSGYPLIEADNKYVQNKNYLYNSENVEYYYIQDSNHYTLTDLVRKSPILCTLLGGGYGKSGYDTLEFINQKCVAFFDKYLGE